MAQNNGLVVDSLNRLQNQVNFNNEAVKLDIDQLKRENDNLKRDNDFLNRDVDQLKRENIQIKFANDQLKQDINQVKQHNDLWFNTLNDEMHNMKSRIMDYFFKQTTTTPRLGNQEFPREPIDDITIKLIINQMPADVPQMNIKTELDDASHNNVISNFSSLPDDAIRLLLIRLPLRHRVMLRIVCHRWKSIIELMCNFSICMAQPPEVSIATKKQIKTIFCWWTSIVKLIHRISIKSQAKITIVSSSHNYFAMLTNWLTLQNT